MFKVTVRRIVAAAGGCLVTGLLVYAFWPAPVDVDFAQVTQGRLRVTINEDGKTRIRERYEVSAPLAGRLIRIGLQAGDRVEAGKTLLAIIEPNDPALLDERARAEARARVKAAEAALEVAKQKQTQADIQVETTRKELHRAAELKNRRSISESEYDQAVHLARIAVEEQKSSQFAGHVARFELDIAMAALVRSGPFSPGETEVFRMEIRAPTDGKVLRIFQKSATVVAPGTKLMEVGDPNDLEAEIDVLSSDGVKIKPGDRVLFEHWGGEETLEGRVRLIEPAAFLKISALGIEEQRVNVIVDFTDPLAKRVRLGDGFRVEARIIIWKKEQTLKVHAGALFRREEGWAVFKAQDGRARIVPVEVGVSNGLETEIRSGLSIGDEVVLHPSDQIRDGARIRAR